MKAPEHLNRRVDRVASSGEGVRDLEGCRCLKGGSGRQGECKPKGWWPFPLAPVGGWTGAMEVVDSKVDRVCRERKRRRHCDRMVCGTGIVVMMERD